MKRIKFSHVYSKFLSTSLPNRAEVLQVLKVNYHELSKRFIKYDTEYALPSQKQLKISLIPEEVVGKEHYPLPKTDLILIILQDPKTKVVFTTMRRYTDKKWKFFHSLQGRIIMLELKDESKKNVG